MNKKAQNKLAYLGQESSIEDRIEEIRKLSAEEILGRIMGLEAIIIILEHKLKGKSND